MIRRTAILLVLLVTAASVGASVSPQVTSSEWILTQTVFGTFDNVLSDGGSNPISSIAMFSGNLDDPATAPSGTASGEGIRLVQSAFGQAVARDIPHPTFVADALQEAREILLWEEYGDAHPGQENFAVFRYLVLLYSRDASAENNIRARFTDMSTLWTQTERDNATEAERILRRAIRYAPQDPELRNLLLDLFYNRAKAEMILARNELVDANRQRLGLQVISPGESIITNEIMAFEQLLPLYDAALQPYSEILNDPLGVNTQRFAPEALPGIPYGAQILLEDSPQRSQFAASFVEGDQLKPVEDANGNPITAEIFSGYKDIVLIFEVLSDQTQAAAELGRRLGIRAQGDDLQRALALVGDTQRGVHATGLILRNLFPDLDLAPNDASGLPAAIGSWRTGMAELDSVKSFIRSETNLLGFSDDFLMLIQAYPPDNPAFFDSYDSMYEYVTEFNSTAPLQRATNLFNDAVTNYAAYQGTLDQLAIQFTSQDNTVRDRIFLIAGAEPEDPAFASPEENVGSLLWEQRQAIQLAQLQIDRNAAEVANLNAQILIEIQRRASEEAINGEIEDVIIDYGDKQANITEIIGGINAAQAFANEMAAAADAVSVTSGQENSVTVSGGFFAHQVNAVVQAAAEVAKGFLEADKEQLAAEQDAEIRSLEDDLLRVESEALIKNLTLQMRVLQIDSLEAALNLAAEYARLTSLYDELNRSLVRLQETNENFATRYFADPIHRLRFQNSVLRAEEAFQNAQQWVFFLTRAVEYKWNQPFVHTTAGGETYDSGSVFRARNAQELTDIVAALEEYDNLVVVSRDFFSDWFSVRDDVFGFIPSSEATPREYFDPVVGDTVDATTRFRRELERLAGGGDSITIEFDTSSGNLGGNLFLGPVFDANGNIVNNQFGTWNDKIDHLGINIVGGHSVANTTLAGQLTQGGTLFIRNPASGTLDPQDPSRIRNEFRAFSSRYFFRPSGAWEVTEALTTPISARLTSMPQNDIPENQRINVFRERSVAATRWSLTLNIRSGNTERVNIDEIDDIEIFFRHFAVPRQN